MRCLTDSCEHAENPYYVDELAEHRRGFRIFELVHLVRPRRIHPFVEAFMYANTHTRTRAHTTHSLYFKVYYNNATRCAWWATDDVAASSRGAAVYWRLLDDSCWAPEGHDVHVGWRQKRATTTPTTRVTLYNIIVRYANSVRYRRYCVRRPSDLGQE